MLKTQSEYFGNIRSQHVKVTISSSIFKNSLILIWILTEQSLLEPDYLSSVVGMVSASKKKNNKKSEFRLY